MTPIISASELATARAGLRRPVLLDVRWQLGGPHQRPAYLERHIPGAVFIDLDAQLAGPAGPGGRHPLPDLAVFGAAMRAAGVQADRPVVVYDGGLGWAAARAWWLLRWTGHPAVRVLDGGLAGWPGPWESGSPQERTVPGDFSPVPGGSWSVSHDSGQPRAVSDDARPDVGEARPAEDDVRPAAGESRLLDADAAAALARSGLLLDARAAERYRGDVEPIDRVGGHIPGAVSAPTTQNVTEDGHFKPAAELARRFAALGVSPDEHVGVYCGSGVSGAHEVLALAVAGMAADLYVGSWSEWSSDASRPVATGPEPQ